MKPDGRTSRRPKPARAKTSPVKTAQEYELTTKRRGELSELAFIFKATSLGFHVSKPYGDSERYDFILDAGPRLWRIQIKSTTTMLCGLYRINSHRRTNHGAIPYQPNEVDFLIAHVIPEDACSSSPSQLSKTAPAPSSLPATTPTNTPTSRTTATPGTYCGNHLSPRRDSRPRLSSRAKLGKTSDSRYSRRYVSRSC